MQQPSGTRSGNTINAIYCSPVIIDLVQKRNEANLAKPKEHQSGEIIDFLQIVNNSIQTISSAGEIERKKNYNSN